MPTTITSHNHSTVLPTPQDDFSIRHKLKQKTKHVLHKVLPGDGVEEQPNIISSELDNNPAFNSVKFMKRPREGPTGVIAKTMEVLKTPADAIAHPKATAKQRATKTTAGKLVKSYPYLSQQSDLDFLDAHDELQQAQNCHQNEDDADRGDAEAKQKRVDDMEERRKSMRVAWITTRHVQRVRVVDNIPPPFPADSYFEELDDCGYPAFNWTKWIGHKLLHGSHSFTAQYIDDSDRLPFDELSLRRSIERFIVVSAPLQTFISDVRCIYRWEDPMRTGQWLVLYLFLWYISHIMTFVYAFIVYSAVMNYYHPTSLTELRSSTKRTVDRSSTAFKVEELMNKHGSDDWLGELMDQAGPHLQVQLRDLLSTLEAISNFYNFYSPRQTVNTLILFSALFLLCAFTDSEFMLKTAWGFLGLLFFVCWPISSLHPRYRHVISPWKWPLWNIPNYPEGCFMYLQERANFAKAKMMAENDRLRDEQLRAHVELARIDAHTNLDGSQFFDAVDGQSSMKGLEISRFFCTYRNTPGYLVITTQGIHFMPMVHHIVPGESFHKAYSEIVELSKRQTRSSVLSPVVNVTSSLDKLDIRFRIQDIHFGADLKANGQVVVLENMKGRDKAFNTIIAFSDVRWQHLQRRTENHEQDKNEIICDEDSR